VSETHWILTNEKVTQRLAELEQLTRELIADGADNKQVWRVMVERFGENDACLRMQLWDRRRQLLDELAVLREHETGD